jgi:hypothetical protein
VPALTHSIPIRFTLAMAAALGLAACSGSPDTVPIQSAGLTRISAQGYAPPPLPPQPRYQPVLERASVHAPGADGTLAASVESAIAAEPELSQLGIDVTAVEGTIYLRGHARTRDSRRLATQVATQVAGVKRVQNELFVMAGS